MQIFNPHFDVSFGGIVFGLGLFAFQKISLGFGLSFFIGGGRSFVPAATWVFAMDIRRITADRAISSNFV